jgi:phospholipase/carboxylesterase
MTDKLLDAIQLETGTAPQASVIWMHGLGADGNDFVPIVHELDLQGTPDIRFVFPHAPMRPVSINNGYVMRAWYDVKWGDLEGHSKQPDESGVRASEKLIAQLVERECARGIAAERIVLAGFSQGGAMALQTGLRFPRKLAGIMALSCYLPLAETFAAEARPENRKTPIFMAHGVQDGVIALEMATTSRDILRQHGYDVEWHDYPMAHSVCLEEIADIGTWLRRILSQ